MTVLGNPPETRKRTGHARRTPGTQDLEDSGVSIGYQQMVYASAVWGGAASAARISQRGPEADERSVKGSGLPTSTGQTGAIRAGRGSDHSAGRLGESNPQFAQRGPEADKRRVRESGLPTRTGEIGASRASHGPHRIAYRLGEADHRLDLQESVKAFLNAVRHPSRAMLDHNTPGPGADAAEKSSGALPMRARRHHVSSCTGQTGAGRTDAPATWEAAYAPAKKLSTEWQQVVRRRWHRAHRVACQNRSRPLSGQSSTGKRRQREVRWTPSTTRCQVATPTLTRAHSAAGRHHMARTVTRRICALGSSRLMTGRRRGMNWMRWRSS